MASIKFYTRGKGRGQESQDTIYLRLTDGRGIDIASSTGITIQRKHWSKTKGMPLNNVGGKTLTTLTKLTAKIIEEYNGLLGKDEKADGKWLKEQILIALKKKLPAGKSKEPTLLEHLENFVDNAHLRKSKKGNPISPRTVQKYRQLQRLVIEYHDKERLNPKVSDVGLDWYEGFLRFMDSQEYGHNYQGHMIKSIRTVLKKAKNKGHHVQSIVFDTSEFAAPNSEPIEIALKMSEVTLITSLDLPNERLRKARDWFIIQVWTGLRVSDLFKLSMDMIDSEDFIEITTQKTGVPVFIPVHVEVQKVLDRWDGFPPRFSDQRYNDYLKELALLAGMDEIVKGTKRIEVEVERIDNGKKVKVKTWRNAIGKFPKWELMASHTARRTFATMHYGQVPNHVIMAITGHKTEAQLLKYVKKTAKENAVQMKVFWNRAKEGEASSNPLTKAA